MLSRIRYTEPHLFLPRLIYISLASFLIAARSQTQCTFCIALSLSLDPLITRWRRFLRAHTWPLRTDRFTAFPPLLPFTFSFFFLSLFSRYKEEGRAFIKFERIHEPLRFFLPPGPVYIYAYKTEIYKVANIVGCINKNAPVRLYAPGKSTCKSLLRMCMIIVRIYACTYTSCARERGPCKSYTPTYV